MCKKKLSMLHNIFRALNMYPIPVFHLSHDKSTFQLPQTIDSAQYI